MKPLQIQLHTRYNWARIELGSATLSKSSYRLDYYFKKQNFRALLLLFLCFLRLLNKSRVFSRFFHRVINVTSLLAYILNYIQRHCSNEFMTVFPVPIIRLVGLTYRPRLTQFICQGRQIKHILC